MIEPSKLTVHASCVAIDQRGVLLRGPSGSGKSDLALRLLDRGAELVSDDYTDLRREGDHIVATAPARISGKIEVRNVGIISWPALELATIALCVRLDEDPVRMPELEDMANFLGIQIAAINLRPFEASAPLKVELALRAVVDAPHNKSEER